MHSGPPRSTDYRRKVILLFATIGLLVLAVACYWYGTNHSNHVLQSLSLMFLLACPLMHLFGHRHGGHGGSRPVLPEKPE